MDNNSRKKQTNLQDYKDLSRVVCMIKNMPVVTDVSALSTVHTLTLEKIR